jgi:30S ribosomal protein S31
MGRGDRRTRRGKIWRGSTGKTRPKRLKKRKTKGKSLKPKPQPQE